MLLDAIDPGTQSMRHRRALDAYEAKLANALHYQPQDCTSSVNVTIFGIVLSLEPWVVARLGGGPDDGTGRTTIVRQALALWLKTSVDMSKLGRASADRSDNVYELQAELMLDSAFGTSLLRELQDCVDGLVKRGDLEEARRFSKLQRDLRGVLKDLKQTIAASSGMSAEALFPTPPPVEPRPAPVPTPAPRMERVLDEAQLEAPAPRPQRRPRPKAMAAVATAAAAAASSKVSRTKFLLTLDAIALLTGLIVTAPLLTLGVTPRALAVSDFPEHGPIVEIQARPPALYAVVSGKSWTAFDEKQKRQFVDRIGNVLLTEGYWGLTVKTSDGRLVADWLQHGGAHVLDTGDAPSAGAAETAAPARAKAPAAQYSRFIP